MGLVGGGGSGPGRQTGSVLVEQEVADGLRQRQGRDVFETSFAQGPADPDAAQVGQSLRTPWKGQEGETMSGSGSALGPWRIKHLTCCL